jgi:hypothetical protein
MSSEVAWAGWFEQQRNLGQPRGRSLLQQWASFHFAVRRMAEGAVFVVAIWRRRFYESDRNRNFSSPTRLRQ